MTFSVGKSWNTAKQNSRINWIKANHWIKCAENKQLLATSVLNYSNTVWVFGCLWICIFQIRKNFRGNEQLINHPSKSKPTIFVSISLKIYGSPRHLEFGLKPELVTDVLGGQLPSAARHCLGLIMPLWSFPVKNEKNWSWRWVSCTICKPIWNTSSFSTQRRKDL